MSPEDGNIQKEITTPERIQHPRRHDKEKSKYGRINAIMFPKTGNPLNHRNLMQTEDAPLGKDLFSNEIGLLSSGFNNNNVKSTVTIEFIPRNDIPLV